MENLDLNIDNYTLIDLLKLFKLDYDFTKEDLKQAKKVVMRVHPDKCNLDKEYFMFFSSAYKMIYYIYDFRYQRNRCKSYKYEIEKDKEKELLLKDISKHKNFNKIFNELFEKNYIAEEETSKGYGEWLKNSEDDNINIENINQMHVEIERKKESGKSLVVKKDILEMQGSSYKDLTGNIPESYSSDIFSSLGFDDIRKAHTETVIPVTNEDYNNIKKYKNLNELKNDRNSQVLEPLCEKDALNYFSSKDNIDNKLSIERAYRLAKQDEQNKKINNSWMRGFKQIKDT